MKLYIMKLYIMKLYIMKLYIMKLYIMKLYIMKLYFPEGAFLNNSQNTKQVHLVSMLVVDVHI